MNTNDLTNYIGHEVVDKDQKRVGTLECLWADQSGQPAYLGVRTGWLMGKTHVVPAEGASVSERGRRIRLPYETERIKDAPAHPEDVQLDPATEREVANYYGTTQTRQQPRQREAARGGDQQEETSVQLREEELKVGKREVEYGAVRLRKVIRTETVNQPVELRREEIVVERVPATEARESGRAFEQEEIYIPLRREEPVVEKQARVREEVRVRKRAETERETVTEQVRKEDVEIDPAGAGASQARQGGRKRAASGEQRTQPRTEQRTEDRRAGNKAVFGIATSEEQASRIVDELKASGFSKNDISVMLADKRSTRDFAHEKNTKAPEGATTGAATGGVLGGTLGWLAGAGALAIPGVGPLVAAGPIMAALGGAAVGAATGGIAGALIGLGIPEYEAKRYENRIQEGNVLISVHSDRAEETRRAREIFERNGAEDIGTANEKETAERRR